MLEKIWPWSRIRDLEQHNAYLQEQYDRSLARADNLLDDIDRLSSKLAEASEQSFSQVARTMPSSFLDGLIVAAFKKVSTDLDNLLRANIVQSLVNANLEPLSGEDKRFVPLSSGVVAFSTNARVCTVEIRIPEFVTRVHIAASEIE